MINKQNKIAPCFMIFCLNKIPKVNIEDCRYQLKMADVGQADLIPCQYQLALDSGAILVYAYAV